MQGRTALATSSGPKIYCAYWLLDTKRGPCRAMDGTGGSRGRRDGNDLLPQDDLPQDDLPQDDAVDDLGQLETENAELRRRAVDIALEIQKLRERPKRQG